MATRVRVLDLFTGTGSVAKALPHAEVVSVDVDPKCNPTHCCDMLEFNYRQYPRDAFDMIWASPPCTAYSVTNTRPSKERLEQMMVAADRLVLRALEICNFFNCPWFLENPVGRLTTRPFMQNLPHRYLVSYCRFGFPYRKHTHIWTNVPGFQAPCCSTATPCDHVKLDGRHPRRVGNNGGVAGRGVHSLNQLHSVPPGLIQSLFAAAGLVPGSGVP